MKNPLFSLALALIPFLTFAQTEKPVQITVTDEVIRSANELEPLGVNKLGDTGGLIASRGNLILIGGFEPIHKRLLFRVIDSGKDEKGHWVTLDGGGAGQWLKLTTGSFSGARMRAYRFVDKDGNPLPYENARWAKGAKVLDTQNVSDMVKLFEGRVSPKDSPGLPEGGWLAESPDTWEEWRELSNEEKETIQSQWRVYYDQDNTLRMDDIVIFEKEAIWPTPEEVHPRFRKEDNSGLAVVGDFRFVEIPKDAPEEMMGGKAVGQLTPDSQTGDGQLWFKLFTTASRKDRFWYGRLDPGTVYRYEAWAKIIGGNSGTLHLGFGGSKPNAYQNGYYGTPLGNDLPVSDQWQRVGFEFTAPDEPQEGQIEGAIVRYKGPGKLLIDNLKLQPVYDPGDADKPFVIYRPQFEEMMKNQPPTGRKGALRGDSLLTSTSTEAMLQWYPASASGDRGLTDVPVPKLLTWAEATGDSPENRMVPHILTQITQNEQDYLDLIEYLSAPYDPAVDTPQTKPMAYLRTQQRGHNRPWSDDFREIIIEMGNENWHNRKMAEWIGVGRYGSVHQGGREMGAFWKYMGNVMMESPYWDGDKMHITFGGNYSAKINNDGSVSGYSQEAVQASGGGIATYDGHATYIGPRWETGESSQTSIDDEGVQKTLFAYRPSKEKEWQRQADANQQLRKLGFDVKLHAYEAGPSGFGLRAKSKEEERAGEYYGKSTAMATAMLDAWLDAWEKGWTHQSYSAYGQGKWWNSHTSMWEGFRPSPSWLIQTIINHTISNRDLLRVEVEGSPIEEFVKAPPKWKKNAPNIVSEVATIQAHAFGGDGYYALALSNLNLENNTPIEVSLPIRSASKVTLYTLTGGPRGSNMEQLDVQIEKRELPSSVLQDGIYRASLPAGMPAVLVFEK
ncbi:MAG: hypothetical protein ACQKBU_08575 [Verrucomicrobiales bacterium]